MSITIFTTGGTIDKTYFDARSTYEVGDPQIVHILRDSNVGIEFRIEMLFRKDSLELTDADRDLLVERVSREANDRILITHGTDTMVDSARALNSIFETSPNKTIVFVGSLSPARFKNSDAEFNIGFALAAVQTLQPGIYIAMNGQIFTADHVRKNRDANRFEFV